MSHVVYSSCKLWQLLTAGGLKKLAWTGSKENKLQWNAQQGNHSLCNKGHFAFTAKSCINMVSVKEKRKSWSFWTNSWIRTEKNQPIFCGDRYPDSCLVTWEWKLWLEMIDTLIISFLCFDWIKWNLKEGLDPSWETECTSVIWGFEVSVSTKWGKGKQNPFTHKLVY